MAGIGMFKGMRIDAVDHQALADWWCRVLGYRRAHDDRPVEGPVLIVDPLGHGPAIQFDPVSETTAVKNRLHMEVYAHSSEIVDGGAFFVRQKTEQTDWDVLADPEGNEFCVLTPPAVGHFRYREGEQRFEPDLSLEGYWEPAEVARRLEGVPARWYVAGGWAIDLFVGKQTRDHGDLEIGLPMVEFEGVHDALAEFEFFVVGSGYAYPLETAGGAFFEEFQTWIRDRGTGIWRLDIMRDPSDGDTWICRRDRRIRRPYDEVIKRSPDGIPYLAPEIALLFKGKGRRPKDEADLAVAAPLLSPEARVWLIDSLRIAYGPDHPWISAVEGPS